MSGQLRRDHKQLSLIVSNILIKIHCVFFLLNPCRDILSNSNSIALFVCLWDVRCMLRTPYRHGINKWRWAVSVLWWKIQRTIFIITPAMQLLCVLLKQYLSPVALLSAGNGWLVCWFVEAFPPKLNRSMYYFVQVFRLTVVLCGISIYRIGNECKLKIDYEYPLNPTSNNDIKNWYQAEYRQKIVWFFK